MGCPSEDALLGFAEAKLAAAGAAAVEEHLAGCESCRAVVAELARRQTRSSGETPSGATRPLAGAEADLPPGTEVGPYRLVKRIGAGAMGVVYEAADPRLGRRLAVKLLRSLGPGWRQAQARLLREASAIARLSHPNVVGVYDVGAFGERAFVAIELVEGPTLQERMREGRSGWRQTLQLFLQAGRGLSAAHAAGIVHRDFKPANVLVGRDGRVRVADFGLARLLDDAGGDAPAATPAGPMDETQIESRSGTRAGTPAYMAPEQHRGEAVDARADQFSFAVAMWEALHGERPFAGADPGKLLAAIDSGQVRPAPAGSRVPARVNAALRRALSARPEDRFASMETLLSALERESPLRRWALGAAVVAVAGALAAVAMQGRGSGLCSGASEELAAVWDAGRQRAVRDALLATGNPNAAEVWSALQRTLDAYAAAFVGMRTEACLATRVRGVQSEPQLELRMECLDECRRQLSALSTQLAAADAKALYAAQKAALSLPAVAGCGDVKALEARRVPRPDPQKRAQAEALRDRIAQARALGSVGRVPQGLEQAKLAADEARALAYRPLLASALDVLGTLQQRKGLLKEALETTRAAAIEAEGGGDDGMAARAYTDLVFHYGRQQNFEEAHLWARHAQAALDRLGGDDLLEGRLHSELAQLYDREHQTAAAKAEIEKALVLLRRAAGPESLAVALALARKANLLRDVDPPAAEAAFTEGLRIFRALYGDSSLEVANALRDAGEFYTVHGNHAEAVKRYRECLDIYQRTGESGNYYYGATQVDLAESLRGLGDFRGAQASDETALAIFEKTAGKDAPKLLFPLAGLGEDALGQGKPEAAVAPLERGLALAGGEKFPVEHASAQFALARALTATAPQRALDLARAARSESAAVPESEEAKKLASRIDAFLAQAAR